MAGKQKRYGLMAALRGLIKTELENIGCDPATARKTAYSGTYEEAIARAALFKKQARFIYSPKDGSRRPLGSVVLLVWECFEQAKYPRREIASAIAQVSGFNVNYVRRVYRSAQREREKLKKSV